MKKLLLLVVIVLTGSLSVYANHDLKVTEGSLAPLREGGNAVVIINMDETMFDNKIPLREDSRFSDVDSNIPEYCSEFCREFNEYGKKFHMLSDKSTPDYSIIIDVKNLDVYVTLFSFKGGVATKIWGFVTIQNANGENVAVLALNEFESSGMTYSVSLEETFEVLAKNLAKRINKGK